MRNGIPGNLTKKILPAQLFSLPLHSERKTKMNKKELSKRYLLFWVSVLFNAFSIALITKALLGTSPISSLPYVLSLFTPFTMGQYTIVMNLLFILLEMALMKREEIREKRSELIIQVPTIFVFGTFIDFSMFLLGWLHPTVYVAQLLALLIGCALLGLGISLEVKANVTMVTGEYLVRVIANFAHREFSFIKVCFDVTLVVASCVLSLVFMSKIDGLREGTVVAALIVGPFSRLWLPCWKVLDKWLAGMNGTNDGR